MKLHHPRLLIVAALFSMAPFCHAASSPAMIEATAFDQLVGGVWTNYNEAALSSLYVKSSGTAPPIAANAKTYYQFDIPSDANTNGPLMLSYYKYNGNSCTLNVWALDQAYPTFDADITWMTAQANKTNSPYELMTDGPFTATIVHTFPDTTAKYQQVITSIPGPWGQFVQDGKLTLVLAEIGPQYALGDPRNADPLYTSGGYRIALNATFVDYTPLSGGFPPSVGVISDLAVRQAQTSTTNSFVVDDPEDGPNGLLLTATSSNTNLVADAEIHFGGTGTNRTVYVVGGPESDTAVGTTTITVTTTDSNGNQGQRAFKVTVSQLNSYPTIACGTPVGTLTNTPVDVPFTVSDGAETPAVNLTVFAEAVGYASNVISTSFSYDSQGSGSNRTMTVTPKPSADGVAVIKLSVVDGGWLGGAPKTNTAYFAVEVVPTKNTVLDEKFSYSYLDVIADTNNAVSGGLWHWRDYAVATEKMICGVDATNGGYALLRGRSGSGTADGASALLLGRPYVYSQGWVIYSIAHVMWLSSAEGLPGTPGTYTASTPIAFMCLSPTVDSAGSILAGVCCNSNATTGKINLKITNNGGTSGINANAFAANQLNFDQFYKLVTRFDTLTAQRTTLWIDASSESDTPAAVAVDITNPATQGSILTAHFRPRAGMGNIYVDDYTVIAVKKPTLTRITSSDGNLTILFSAQDGDSTAGFVIQKASPVTGSFSDVSASISDLGGGVFQAVVSASGDEGYFRVRRTPLAF